MCIKNGNRNLMEFAVAILAAKKIFKWKVSINTYMQTVFGDNETRKELINRLIFKNNILGNLLHKSIADRYYRG